MDEPKYEKIGEVSGRWKAEIIESLLQAEGIEVVLVQESITHYVYKSAFDPVEIYVPSAKASEARTLVGSMDDFGPEEAGPGAG
jgi:hypothetical protein